MCISLFTLEALTTSYIQVSVSKARAVIVIAEDGNADQVSGNIGIIELQCSIFSLIYVLCRVMPVH